MSPTSCSPSNTRSRCVSVTSPIGVARVSQRSQTASTASSRAGSTTHSIRSCDSEIMISNGSMPASRSGTLATSRSMPTPPLEAISLVLEDSPAAPRSCSATSSSRSTSSRQHSISLLSSSGSPICTLGRLRVAFLELRRGQHAGAADAVAAGARAEQHDHVARPRGGGADQPLGRREADAHRVDEAVLLVRRLEVDLAADGRHADGVAVGGDAGHHALEQVARARRVEVAEAQRVEHRDRPRAEREDVAQDAADAGGRALERLDRGRVVVAFDLEHDREPVARRRSRRRSRPGPSARARPRWAACAAASWSACRRSARTTAARTRPARARSARARAARRCGASRRR